MKSPTIGRARTWPSSMQGISCFPFYRSHIELSAPDRIAISVLLTVRARRAMYGRDLITQMRPEDRRVAESEARTSQRQETCT